MTRVLNYLLLILLSILIIVIPMNLFLQISRQGSFVNGLQVDYLILKIYAADIIILALGCLWGCLWGCQALIKSRSQPQPNKIKEEIIYSQNQKSTNLLLFWQSTKNRLQQAKAAFEKKLLSRSYQSSQLYAVLIALAALILRQILTPQPVTALFFFFKVLIAIFAAWFLYQHQDWLRSKYALIAMLISFLLQLGLGFYQFLAQQPLLPYYYLGEPKFEPYYRLSRHLFNGREKILAYGSTAHPNILAATGCLLFLMITLQLKQKIINQSQKPRRRLLLSAGNGILLLACLGLIYITQAKSVLLVLLLGNLFIWKDELSLEIKPGFVKKFLLFVLAVTPLMLAAAFRFHSYQPSIFRRHLLNTAAVRMLFNRPLLGQGLNQFTLQLEQFLKQSEVIRFVQPAHHIGLLWLAETGLLGISVLILIYQLIASSIRNSIITGLAIVSPMLAMDHFFYSLQPGRLLLILFIVYWLSFNHQTQSSPNHHHSQTNLNQSR